MWKVELLSLVENQEEPVHNVEEYEHPREGFQKELVNPPELLLKLLEGYSFIWGILLMNFILSPLLAEELHVGPVLAGDVMLLAEQDGRVLE